MIIGTDTANKEGARDITSKLFVERTFGCGITLNVGPLTESISSALP